jgi:hypothetical protein
MSLKPCSFDMDVPLTAVPRRPIAEGAAAVYPSGERRTATLP